MRVEGTPRDAATHGAREQGIVDVRRTEQQLAEAQALAHVGSWDWDLVNDRFSVSEEYNRILGLPVGHPVTPADALARVHPDDRAMVEHLVAQAPTNRRPFSCEFRILRPDGSERVVDAHVKIELDESGRPIRHHGTVQDVTDRKRAEETLRRAEQEFHDIFEYASVGIFRASRDGRILLANTAFAKMLGYESFDELRTLDLARDVYADPAEREALIARAEPMDRGYAFEIQWKRRDGTPFWVLLNAHTVKDAAGHTRYFEAFVQDVTERRRGVEVRRHLLARAISAQEDERKRVARELHDEAGQALSAILVGLRGIAEGRSLEQVRALAERLCDVTAETIRAVGRIARGLRPSTLDDLGLVPALRRYAEDLSALQGLQITITPDSVGRFPAQVETTLYRIIQEGLTNVARHAQARSAKVVIARQNSDVRATVVDNGCGFDAAAELHPAALRRGLGLVGMQERAELLGGRLAIDSRPGAGTIVTVTLPLE